MVREYSLLPHLTTYNSQNMFAVDQYMHNCLNKIEILFFTNILYVILMHFTLNLMCKLHFNINEY